MKLFSLTEMDKFWRPVIVSLVLTPVCLFIGLVSAGMGEGNFILARVLFPYIFFIPYIAKLILILPENLPPEIVLSPSIIQFPLYGFVLGMANKKDAFNHVAVFIVALHLFSMILCFVLTANKFQ